MFNPINQYINLFWPSDSRLSKDLQVRYRVLLYFHFYSLLVMTYSIVKWSKADYFTLVYSSAFGFIVILGCSLLVKLKVSPLIAANMTMLGTYPHGMNMIFSLGGLNSAHIYWLPALVCIAYLLANRKSGIFWFCVALASLCALIYFDRADIVIWNQFEFTEAQKRLDTYSGYLLPLIII